MRSNNDVICKYCGWGISHHSPNCGQIQSLELQLAEARKELAACRATIKTLEQKCETYCTQLALSRNLDDKEIRSLESQLSTYEEALMEILCNTDGEIREIALQALTQSNPPKAEK